MSETLLKVTDLCVERGERRLFDQMHFQIGEGQVIQVAGPNGSGKTSLLKVLSGLATPVNGLFSWRGQKIFSANSYSDELLYVGHKPAVSMQLTPLENLRSYELTQGTTESASPKLIEALSDLGLVGYEDELCSRLSAGQKRRVGLARLRVTRASLWVLDEPFTAIDARGVECLCGWIAAYVAKGGSVVFTTHQAVEFPNLTPEVLDLTAVR